MREIELEVGRMIIETLDLKDVSVDDLRPLEPMFYDGLGLDSIDALEISLAMSSRYGVQVGAKDANVNEIFSSIRALSEYIQRNRQR